MNFNFDKNLKIEIIEEAIKKNEIDLYRAIVMGGYIVEDFDPEDFEPDTETVTDVEIQRLLGKRDKFVLKLEELKS
jgi:hypothetical protein